MIRSLTLANTSLVVAFLLWPTLVEAQLERPKPQPWSPINSGQGYSSIPSPDEFRELAVDASKNPKLVNLFIIGGEHRLELQFTRTAGNGGLALSFPVGSESAVLLIDCFPDEGPYSGIDWVRGTPITNKVNPTSHKGRLLETGKLHRLLVEVRRGHVLVELDGKRIVDADLGPDDVGGSHLLYPPSPADIGLKLFDGKFLISRYRQRGIWASDPREPEELPKEGVEQILGAGDGRDRTKFAVQLAGPLTLQSDDGALLNFQSPLTVECWFRQSRENNEWFLLLNSYMGWELRKEDYLTKRPVLGLKSGPYGINGEISSWDTKWHHIASSSDQYYTYLYFDGRFVCRSHTAYLGRDTLRKPVQIGYNPSPGSRIRSFDGEIRDFRISNVNRYPRSKSFEPPEMFGHDEHVTCQLDLRQGTLALRPTAKSLGNVQVTADGSKIIRLED